MGKTPAVFHAPLTYLGTDKKQVVIGLSEIWFDDDGDLTVHPKHTAALPWLNHLVNTGVITPAPPGTGPAKTAMVLRSTMAGSAGNDIQVEVSHSGSGTFDITVTQKNTYAGLTPEELPVVLGTDQTTGTRPGLLRIKYQKDKPPQLPQSTVQGQKLELTYEIKGTKAEPGEAGKGATRGFWNVPLAPGDADSTDVAFTLEARDPGEEPIKTTITINPADSQKLTLEACWTKTVSGISSDSSEAIANELGKFGYVLTASKPAEGDYAAPRSGTFKLQGGLDSTFASFAPSAKQSA